MFRNALVAAGLIAALSVPAIAVAQQPGELVHQVNRSGPRFGLTYLGGAIVDTIGKKFDVHVGKVITQFGWQFENQLVSLESGPVALSDVVLLIGALDQGTYLPSLSWLVGIRSMNNWEFGVGPNATPAGVALAISVGKTFHSGALALPVNIAVVPGRVGTRYSVLTGFNLYR